MTISADIKKKLATQNLSVAAGAKKARVSYQAFSSVVKGISLPNARCLGKYAKLLGVTSDQLQASIQKERLMAKKPGPGRPKGAAKKKVVKKAAKKVVKKAAKKVVKKAAKKPVKKVAKKKVAKRKAK